MPKNTMENIQNTPSPEELKLEQEALGEAKEAEIREQVIAEFGFDEVDDSERIDKVVAKEMKSRKDLSEAIGQKINWRKKAIEVEPPKTQESKANVIDPDEFQKKVKDTVQETLEQRDLESLEYPDELKGEISRIAKASGVSVKKALADPYIQFKIGEHEKAKQVEYASIGRTNRAGGKQVYSVDNPPDVDVSTPEGAKIYDEWFEKARKDPKYQPNT